MSKSMRKRYRTKLDEEFPNNIKLTIGEEEINFEKTMSLRYGENPHQPAAFYSRIGESLTTGALKLLKTGKGGLSQTNLEDVNNSMNIVRYFETPACAVMKHLNPSGVSAYQGPGDSVKDIYIRARDCDSLAAFGSVVGFNSNVDEETAEEIMSTYVEAVVAPSYEETALDILGRKRDFRVIQVTNLDKISKFDEDPYKPLMISMQMDGSFVLSAPFLTRIKKPEDLRFVTKTKPSSKQISDLIFSWYVCMNVRSNGVVLSKNMTTMGVGTGQQDRVTAVKLSLEKAIVSGHGDELSGSVLASDGFFPFRDSVDLLAEHGVAACIQPGGSIRDKEVIEACNEFGIAMAFTDERCFKHF